MENFTTKQKGDYSEVMFIAWALERGAGVSMPIGDRLPYDVIVDVEGTLVRAQVKTIQYVQDCLSISVSSITTSDGSIVHRTYRDKVDVIVGFDSLADKFYVLKPKDFETVKRNFTLRVEEPLNGQIKGVHLAKDFNLVNVYQLLPDRT